MKSLLSNLIFFFVLSSLALAQEPVVTPLNLPEGSNVGEITGNIDKGQIIPMGWAESSSVALVPATRFEQFNGNQVFYRITMPAASVINIKMKPQDGKKINLYALRQSAQGAQEVPPNVTRAISSEASYPIYANMGGGRRVQNEDKGYREVEFMSVNRPYSILIGVSGAEGETEGEFLLRIEIKSR
ncbi:MAG: hypothetical protein KC800_31600 [Candidatus Eremiobacteraeota bacterium]|nr:hypothetical protein [Candidatus Eremiobacteraeota bacterium]